MVLNGELAMDETSVAFNSEFISRYQIKSIEGRISTKRPKQTIRRTNLHCGYFFDSHGRISSSYEQKSYRDTIFNRYFYNDRGRLIYKSKEDKVSLRYESYLWDEKGRIKEIEIFERKKDKMGIPYTRSILEESFDFKLCDSSCVKVIKNKVGTPFMNEESFYNSNGDIQRIERRYIVTNEGTIEYFIYDEEGRLIKRDLVSSKQKLNKETYTFKYDDFDNLKEKQFFKKGELQFDKQIIVNEKSGFLSAILEQDNNTNILKIIQFNDFSYFD